MKTDWPWSFKILTGLVLISCLLAGCSDRETYFFARSGDRRVARRIAREAEAAQPPAPTEPSARGDCLLLAQSPANGTIVGPGAGFTASWTLQNTSSDKWSSGEVDIRYIGAAWNMSMHQGQNIYDLPTDVAPEASFTFSEAMLAPTDPGTYGERWELAQGMRQICEFEFEIEVK